MITVELTCETCGPVMVIPDRFTDNPEVEPGYYVIPIGGLCPKCNRRYEWKPENQYLAKFEPVDMKETEQPTFEITIHPVNNDDNTADRWATGRGGTEGAEPRKDVPED